MENASKALIIAGAILLSILLITLGIMIFTQAQSAINGSGMSEIEVNSFNQKFLKYEGNQKGSAIRSLVQEVMSNNNNEQASDETMVSINVNNGTVNKTGTDTLIKLAPGEDQTPVYGADFKNTKTYTVSFGYNGSKIAVINIK